MSHSPDLVLGGAETLLAALKAEEAQQWEQAYGLYAEAKLRLGVQLAQERLPATCEAYRRKISVCLERRAAIRSKGCLPLGQVRTSQVGDVQLVLMQPKAGGMKDSSVQTSEIGSEPDTPASPRTPGTPQTPRRESSGHIALAAARGAHELYKLSLCAPAGL